MKKGEEGQEGKEWYWRGRTGMIWEAMGIGRVGRGEEGNGYRNEMGMGNGNSFYNGSSQLRQKGFHLTVVSFKLLLAKAKGLYSGGSYRLLQ